MTRDEIHDALGALEGRSGLGRREFGRAVRSYLGNPRGWLSVAEASKALGVSERRVRQLCSEGRLSSVLNPHTRKTWVSPYSVQGHLAKGRFRAKVDG